jgi:hypothetical protein
MKRARVHRRRRGQAMVEYSMITWILLAGLLFLGSVPIFKTPVPGGLVTHRNVIEMMLEAYQRYYDGFFLVLSAPYP